MFVQPKQGLQVRDPVSYQPLPPEGAEVPRDSYWLRRLRSGDVVEAKPVQIPDSVQSAREVK